MAYEIDVLVERLKGRGLDFAEDAAKIVLDEVFLFIEEEAKKSENTYDDLLLAILPLVKPLILEKIDEIDGKEG